MALKRRHGRKNRSNDMAIRAREAFRRMRKGQPQPIAWMNPFQIYLILDETEKGSRLRLCKQRYSDGEEALKELAQLEDFAKRERNTFGRYAVPYLPELATLIKNYLLLKGA